MYVAYFYKVEHREKGEAEVSQSYLLTQHSPSWRYHSNSGEDSHNNTHL